MRACTYTQTHRRTHRYTHAHKHTHAWTLSLSPPPPPPTHTHTYTPQLLQQTRTTAKPKAEQKEIGGNSLPARRTVIRKWRTDHAPLFFRSSLPPHYRPTLRACRDCKRPNWDRKDAARSEIQQLICSLRLVPQLQVVVCFCPPLLTQLAQSSGAVWKSWSPVPNKPTVSVDVKQHFNN